MTEDQRSNGETMNSAVAALQKRLMVRSMEMCSMCARTHTHTHNTHTHTHTTRTHTRTHAHTHTHTEGSGLWGM